MIDKQLDDGAVRYLELIWNRNVNNRRRERSDLQVGLRKRTSTHNTRDNTKFVQESRRRMINGQ